MENPYQSPESPESNDDSALRGRLWHRSVSFVLMILWPLLGIALTHHRLGNAMEVALLFGGATSAFAPRPDGIISELAISERSLPSGLPYGGCLRVSISSRHIRELL